MSSTGTGRKSRGVKKQKRYRDTGDLSRREEGEELCDTPAFMDWVQKDLEKQERGGVKSKEVYIFTGDLSRREEDEKLCDPEWEWKQYQKLMEQDNQVTYPALPQPTADPSTNHTFSQTRAIGFKHGFDDGNCDAYDIHGPYRNPDLMLESSTGYKVGYDEGYMAGAGRGKWG